MKNIKRLILIIMLILAMPSIIQAESQARIKKGTWVTCFSKYRVHYSTKAAFELVQNCKKKGIDEIYLQLYRNGVPYYDTGLGSRQRYEAMIKAAAGDPIDVILSEAKRCNIQVFAWVNVLCVNKNKKADILERFGDSVLTRDQYDRPSMRTEDRNESDKYYLRDEQIFLEPGDERVSDYALSIIGEIITRYPDLSGVHLDYVRYPYPIPFIPRSNFNKFGLTYGYGEENVKRFSQATGLNPKDMPDKNDNFLKWDNWKRGQVTSLVSRIAKHVKDKNAGMMVSCAVIPSSDTAYSASFQDWPGWLEEGIVDYVVLMNYTKNNQLAKEITRSSLAHRGKGKIYIGIGNFLMENDPGILAEQERTIKSLKPDGIVYYSYDFL